MGQVFCRAAGRVSEIALFAAFAIGTLQAQTPAERGHQPVGPVTLKGCMQPGTDRTTLTDETGTTYLLDHIRFSSPKRAFVEVHGEQLSPAGRHGEAALPEIRVASMHTLSNICPEKTMPPPSNYKPHLPSAESPSTPPYESPNAPQPQEGAPVLNSQGAGGAPSPGTGDIPEPPPK